MTRKRFVKLRMAMGDDRNTANKTARLIREDGMSYAEYMRSLKCFGTVLERITKGMQNVVDAARKVTTALAAGLDAFGKAYREAMAEPCEVEP